MPIATTHLIQVAKITSRELRSLQLSLKRTRAQERTPHVACGSPKAAISVITSTASSRWRFAAHTSASPPACAVHIPCQENLRCAGDFREILNQRCQLPISLLAPGDL